MSCKKNRQMESAEPDLSKQVAIHMNSVDGFGLNAEWQLNATELIRPQIDIYFLLDDGGNFHDAYKAEFTYPPLEREFTDRVSVNEIIGNEQQLVTYYRQIIQTAKHYKIPFRDISHLFWLRLEIHDRSSSNNYGFAHYDTLSDITRFQDWVTQSDTGELYSDLYQGWGFEAQIKLPFVYMIEYNPDYESEFQKNYISYSYLENELALATSQARRIIGLLTEGIGNDLWSTYRGYPWDDVKF